MGEEIVRLRWSVGPWTPWEGRARCPGTYLLRVRGWGGTEVRGYEATLHCCEGGKRNGAMNRRQREACYWRTLSHTVLRGC